MSKRVFVMSSLLREREAKGGTRRHQVRGGHMAFEAGHGPEAVEAWNAMLGPLFSGWDIVDTQHGVVDTRTMLGVLESMRANGDLDAGATPA